MCLSLFNRKCLLNGDDHNSCGLNFFSSNNFNFSQFKIKHINEKNMRFEPSTKVHLHTQPLDHSNSFFEGSF